MDKIIEISLAKIENSKSRKVTGKSNMLHRNLLVNTLLNRVRTSDKSLQITEPLMNYREPRSLVDMDIDDYDMEKIANTKERKHGSNIQHTQQQITLTRKQSSLVTKLNTRSLSGKPENSLCKDICKLDDITETKENKEIPCECLKLSNCKSEPALNIKHAKKRSRLSEQDEQNCPTKKLRCLWPTNVSPKVQELSYSITSLASLFGDLDANTDTENLSLGRNYVTAMVAC